MPEVGTRLHAATTKSQSGNPCKFNNDPNEEDMQKKGRQVTAKEAGDISNRLYSAKTKSGAGENCKYEPTIAKDIVERKGTNVKDSTARLSAASTKSWSAEVCKAKPTVAEPPDIKLPEDEVDDIVERLNKTHTKSSSATVCRAKPVVADNSIARKPESKDEVNAIFNRIQTTHTKSSSGGECKQIEPLKPPGLGQKMLPNIDGLDKRFSGKKTVKNENADSIFTRLSSAHTRSSKARGENPKILLYPERTLLCNNVSRIVAFQQSGDTVKQGALARREKWFI